MSKQYWQEEPDDIYLSTCCYWGVSRKVLVSDDGRFHMLMHNFRCDLCNLFCKVLVVGDENPRKNK